jgi:hypothetical protein
LNASYPGIKRQPGAIVVQKGLFGSKQLKEQERGKQEDRSNIEIKILQPGKLIILPGKS